MTGAIDSTWVAKRAAGGPGRRVGYGRRSGRISFGAAAVVRRGQPTFYVNDTLPGVTRCRVPPSNAGGH